MTTDETGNEEQRRGGGWQPTPQGEYDGDATAFVQLPPDVGLDGIPLEAPGHGYVPPHIPDPHATAQWNFQDALGSGPAQTGGSEPTGQWAVPVAPGDLPEESGEYALGPREQTQTYGGGQPLAAWADGTAPATLPGGAAAPWAVPAPPEPTTDTAPPEGPSPDAGYAYGTDYGADYGTGHDAGYGTGHGSDHDRDRGADHDRDRGADYGTGHGADYLPGHGTDDGAGYFGGRGAGHGPQAPGTPEPPTAEPPTSESPTAGTAPHAQVPGESGHAAPDYGLPEHGAPDHGPSDHGAPHHGPSEHAAEFHDVPGPDAADPVAAPVAGPPATAGPEQHAPAADPAYPHHDADPAQAAAPTGTTADAPATADGHATADGPATDGDPAPEAQDLAEAEALPETQALPEPEPDPVPVATGDEHPHVSYVLRVNGADRPVTDAWIGESLLYVLRERLGLAGAKDGCSQGECGACNVQVDGRLVASCLVPAATAAGSEVRTVEGLAAGGEPSDVQRALARCGAVQCGFCIPGMAMTVHDLLEGNHAPSDVEARQALSGNLCRCTGYQGALRAVREVVAERTAAQRTGGTAGGPDEPPHEVRIPHQLPHAHDGGTA
ncbi:2Fe-2S iron-sulfur cluster-binding protein [Streptomyces kanasensis]|uniref:2Fe-2S iron-sulfur cluster-binding protein n=1 Tax=Streptomyces kanasensis TaxID=936756 RepID=UPI0036F58C54